MDYLNFITVIVSTLAAGGWFINYREKKKLEASNAEKAKTESDSEKVDLIDKIMDKYQKTILDNMNFNSEKHNQQHEQIMGDLALISEYLNGGFSEFKSEKKTSKKHENK